MQAKKLSRLTDHWSTCIMHERNLWMTTLDEAIPTSDAPRSRLLGVGYEPIFNFHDFDFLNKIPLRIS